MEILPILPNSYLIIARYSCDRNIRDNLAPYYNTLYMYNCSFNELYYSAYKTIEFWQNLCKQQNIPTKNSGTIFHEQ